MDKVSTFWDLISGFLVAIDVAAPSWGSTAGDWLTRHLPQPDDKLTPFKARTFWPGLALTFLSLSILFSFALSKDEHFQWSTAALFLSGVIIGVIVVFLLTLIASWLQRTYVRRQGTTNFVLDQPTYPTPSASDLLRIIWPFLVAVGVLSLYLLLFATGSRVFLAAPILTFVLTVCVLPTTMLSNQSFVNYLVANPKNPYYPLARIGLLIFIISKLVYLKM